jgi:alpha-ketoglutarate-dependent 2,4-dichlorophenoxyacetate dioxygenase
LLAFATQERFVHKWHVGDLVIWDNRRTLHRATLLPSKDHKREVRRTTVVDTQGDMAAVYRCRFCSRNRLRNNNRSPFFRHADRRP